MNNLIVQSALAQLRTLDGLTGLPRGAVMLNERATRSGHASAGTLSSGAGRHNMTELDLRHDARIFSALLEASDSSGTTRRQEPTAALAGHKSKGIGPSGDHRGASASRSHSSNGTSSPHTYSGEAYLPLAAQPIPQVVNTIVPVADSSPSLPELIEKHVRRTLLCVGA